MEVSGKYKPPLSQTRRVLGWAPVWVAWKNGRGKKYPRYLASSQSTAKDT